MLEIILKLMQLCPKIYTMMILPILTYAGLVKITHTKTQTDRLTSLHRGVKAITGNNHLNCIMSEIQRQNCLLVKKRVHYNLPTVYLYTSF